MQSLTQPTRANINTNTPLGSSTQARVPFQMLGTAQTRTLHATQLQQSLTSFTHTRTQLRAQTDAFAVRSRVAPGINPSAEHEALLKECRSALGPAALAAVAPGGFRGALGGYANTQRISAALSSASNGLPGYIADRSTSASAPPSPLSEPVPTETLDRAPRNDESRHPRVGDSQCEANVKCGTEREGHVEQPSQPRFPIAGTSGLLIKPQLWNPRDRKASTQRYGPGHRRTASPPTQIKQEPDADTHLLSIGTLATLESPPILAVERDGNSKLKRARNSAEDSDSDDEESRRPRVKAKLESLDNTLGKSMHTRTRPRAHAAGSTTSTRVEIKKKIKDEPTDLHTAYGLGLEGSSSTSFNLNTLPPISAPTPAQLLTPISLAVERKNLKRARNSAEDDDDDNEEARKPSRRMKFEEAAGPSSHGVMTRRKAKTQAHTPSLSPRRPSQSRSISADVPAAAVADPPVADPPVATPLRRSARLQGRTKRKKMCVVCPEGSDCHTHIS